MKASLLILVVVSLLFILSCSDPAELLPPTDEVSEADQLSANNSETKAVLDPGTLNLTIQWIDRFTDENAFGIEKLNSESWQRVATLPFIEGTDNETSWTTTMEESGEYRVVVDKPDYSLPLHSSSGNDQFQVAIPTTTPTITIDTEEPIIGNTIISLNNASGITAVDYFINFQTLGSSSQADDFPVNWHSNSVANGIHLISAMATTSPGVYLDLRRQVQVDNPNFSLVSTLSATFGEANLDVTTFAEMGVESVESFVDGNSIGVLTSPNYQSLFRWTIDTQNLDHGTHSFRTHVMDRSGNSLETTLTQDINQPPVPVLDYPSDGAIVSGTLTINGSFTDDAPGTVLTAHLGSLTFFTTTESPFTGQYSLDQVAPGNYTLSIRATDTDNFARGISLQIVVEDPDIMSSELIKGNAQLLDAKNGDVLFQTPNEAVYIRSSGGSEQLLPDTAAIVHSQGWQLCQGNALVYGVLNGYPNPYQVFLYDASGQRRNLSEETQTGAYFDVHPVSQWPWVVWHSSPAKTYFLLNLQTDQVIEIDKPAGTSVTGNHQFDLAVSDTDTRLFYWAGTSPDLDVYYFSTLTGTSTKVTTSGLNTSLTTDNERVAWKLDSHTYLAGPVSSPQSASSFTDIGNQLELGGGVLAWVDFDGVSQSIIVDDGIRTTLSLLRYTYIFAVGGDGYVVFWEPGQMKVWDRQNGIRVVMNSDSAKVIVDGHDLYVQTPGNSIYKFDLR